MTTPSLSRQSSSGRVYVWPPEPPHELEVPSVTAILSGGIPKPALIGWAAREVATAAVSRQDVWRNMDNEEAVTWLKGSPYRGRDRKASRGTDVHAAVETYVTTGEIVWLEPDAAGFLKAAVRFEQDFEPVSIFEEATVYSREHGYAGTADRFAGFEFGRAVVDYKTGNTYPEHQLQLCAYGRGDFIGLDDGVEVQVPRVDVGVLVKLKGDGTYEARCFDFTDELFLTFLAAKRTHDWLAAHGRRVVGKMLKPEKARLAA